MSLGRWTIPGNIPKICFTQYARSDDANILASHGACREAFHGERGAFPTQSSIMPLQPQVTQSPAPHARRLAVQCHHGAETVTATSNQPPAGQGQSSQQEDPKTASVGEQMAAKRAERLERCPTSARSLLARCWSKKAPPRQVIKSFCQECCGYDRAAIAECTAWACPMFEYRPYQKPPMSKAVDTSGVGMPLDQSKSNILGRSPRDLANSRKN